MPFKKRNQTKRNHTFGKRYAPSATVSLVSQLFFYKVDISMKQSTKIYMRLTEHNKTIWMIMKYFFKQNILQSKKLDFRCL